MNLITMVKKLFLFLLLAAPLSIVAQDKLAYINAEEVFFKMPEMKDVETKLAAKRETILTTQKSLEDEYQKKVEEFQKTPTETLSESVLMTRQKDLEDMQQRYQVFMQQSAQEFEREQQQLIAPLRDKFAKIVKEVGDENGYTYILNSGALIHIGSNAVDASPKVKAKLGITE